jgi:CHRD domain-containing protein
MVTRPNNRHILPVVGFAVGLLIVSLAANTLSPAFGQQQQQQQPQHKQLVAKLSGKNEVPPVNTAATGTANFTVSPDGKPLHYILTVHNITGVIGADIHWGTSTQDGPVILAKGTITSSGIKGNMTRNPGAMGMEAITTIIPNPGVMGIVAKGTMISSPNVIHIQELIGSVSDLVTLFNSNSAYVNVHTQMHQNGEIRGQISLME